MNWTLLGKESGTSSGHAGGDIRGKGTNKSLSDDDQAPCQEPNTQTEASA
ncbi:hypothetical protein HanXRQr2_Chr16g0762781 [Helianthus annuus]|uniref:Uncharacterized protein n=1 Tax=Helianthus annuus TaxID=4232 RepID=A0A9K3DW03_HELAN|nr:hypothetical protein HanXRQr2_Chr16g0762781 [Helianthus annuus]KAJ0959306.1 hypothetical protein HanPSC8_Chr00c193g0806241 [Helianthus annuus]